MEWSTLRAWVAPGPLVWSRCFIRTSLYERGEAMTALRTALVAAPPILAAGALAAASVPVSPEGISAHACPTFSWSLSDGAEGYEVVVYGVDDRGEAGVEPVLSATLPVGVQSWTPSAERCLEWGGSYAWSVRALDGDGAGEWSGAELFEVAGAPSPEEVAAAVETLRRYLAEGNGGAGADAPALEAASAAGSEVPAGRVEGMERPRPGRGLPPSPAAESEAAAMGKSAPVGSSTPSLTLSGQLHLDADSHVFRNGRVFLWEDSIGNLGLGENALASATGTVSHNTAVGEEALSQATEGDFGVNGSSNTAVGFRALFRNAQGFRNTAGGFEALINNSTGFRNTAFGWRALHDTTGDRNTALGADAGVNAGSGTDNVFIGSGATGASGDANTIRIGGSTGTGDGQQNRTFIAGIEGISLGLSDAEAVQINSNGRLGTIVCGDYMEASFCPVGTNNPDGPKCSRVPPGSFCESDGECGTDAGLDNCGGADWYLRVD